MHREGGHPAECGQPAEMRNGSEDGTDDTMVDEVHQYQKLTCQKRWVQLDETKNKKQKQKTLLSPMRVRGVHASARICTENTGLKNK